MNTENFGDCVAPATNTCLHRLIGYYEPIEYVFGVISIVLGLFTIYVILRHSTREMSPYKWFILHVTIWDLLAAMYVSLLFSPVPLFPAFAMAINGPVGRFVADGGAIKLFVVMLDFYILCAMAISFCFVYRYTILNYDGIRRRRRLQAYCLFLVIFALFAVLIISYEVTSDPTPSEEVTKYLLEIRPHWREEIGNFVIFGSLNTAARNGSHTLLVAVAIGGNIVFSAVFAFLIHRRLSEQKAILSERTYHMHRMLTIALTTQISLPVVCTAVPMLSVQILMQTQTVNDILSLITFCPVFLYHPLNSLATLYFSEPYRRATIAIVRRLPGGGWFSRRFSTDSQMALFQQTNSNHRMRSIISII